MPLFYRYLYSLPKVHKQFADMVTLQTRAHYYLQVMLFNVKDIYISMSWLIKYCTASNLMTIYYSTVRNLSPMNKG